MLDEMAQPLGGMSGEIENVVKLVSANNFFTSAESVMAPSINRTSAGT
jgi:hypothetical protein